MFAMGYGFFNFSYRSWDLASCTMLAFSSLQGAACCLGKCEIFIILCPSFIHHIQERTRLQISIKYIFCLWDMFNGELYTTIF
jgi:hypothetical protein